MTTIPDTGDAATALAVCRASLREARDAAQSAASFLKGARRSRALELGELLADCTAHCERLRFLVEADLAHEGEAL